MSLPLSSLLLAFSTAVAGATFGVLSRFLLKESKNPLAFAVVYGALTGAFSLLFFIFEPWQFSDINAQIILVTIVAVILFTLFESFEFYAHKNLEASRFSVIYQLTPAVTFFASIWLLHENFSTPKLFAVLLIIAGNLVAVYKHEGAITKKGLLFGLGTALWLGLAYVADKAVFEHYPLPLYMALTYGAPALLILPFMGESKIQTLKEEIQRVSWGVPLLAFVSVVGYYLVLKTFQVLEASIAIPIMFSGAILATLGGIIFLKERANILQKLLGILFVFVGVVLLS